MKAEFQVSYFLWKERKNEAGLAPVYIRSAQNSKKQFIYNTGVRLPAQQWNKSKNEPKNKPAALLALEGNLKATYRDLLAQGYEPNLNDLIIHLNDNRKPTGKGIVEWANDYLKGDYSIPQKRNVRTLITNIGGKTNKEGKTIIEGFNKGLTFDKLTRPRLKSFFEWLTKNNVANNSQYKRLRALINIAGHANIDIPHLTNYKFPYEKKNALKTRLNWAEVKSVMNTKPENELEAIAKDVFLLACFSGLRIADLLTLNRGELHDYHYERVQGKTKQPVLTTIHKYNIELFHKYITGISFTRQTLSGALKPVLERSGMTKDILVIRQVGNNFRETLLPKYKEISFHSGRRFYSRLLSDLGLGAEIVRDELGHSFRSISDLYAGSQEHSYRVARVRKSMEGLEETLEQLAGLMKVAS